MTHGEDPSGWGERDWRAARESWRRRRMAEGAAGPRGRPPWFVNRGFGCLFALLFLFVAGSLVAGSAYILSHLGRFPGFVAIVFVVVMVSIVAGLYWAAAVAPLMAGSVSVTFSSTCAGRSMLSALPS